MRTRFGSDETAIQRNPQEEKTMTTIHKNIATLSAALALALGSFGALAAPAAPAADAAPAAKPRSAQQQKMAQCNKDATGKKGDERKAFMKACLSKKPAA
jgi:invasion protein IalB